VAPVVIVVLYAVAGGCGAGVVGIGILVDVGNVPAFFNA